MIDVTIHNFEAEVIAASQTVPVLVDFWATWCEPCKVIGPLLEKLETEYAGRFKLVKIDSDQEQQLAAAFGVRSIPTCVLLKDGQPVDGFMGALPLGQIKAFLDKNLPEAQEALEAPALEVENAEPLDEAAALEKLQHSVATDPANDQARFDYVKLLLQQGRDDDAKVAFAPAIAKAATQQNFAALQSWFTAIDFAFTQKIDAMPALEKQIAADKRDFDARYQRAQIHMSQQKWTEAMDELLEILMRDKNWSEDKARKTYIAILDIIETPKTKVEQGQIPAEDPVVASYRRRLSSVILS